MDKLQYIITGCVSCVIGILLIYNRKSILQMILNTQKDVDQLLQKENCSHSKFKYHFVPNFIIIIIGIGLFLIGLLSVLMAL